MALNLYVQRGLAELLDTLTSSRLKLSESFQNHWSSLNFLPSHCHLTKWQHLVAQGSTYESPWGLILSFQVSSDAHLGNPFLPKILLPSRPPAGLTWLCSSFCWALHSLQSHQNANYVYNFKDRRLQRSFMSAVNSLRSVPPDSPWSSINSHSSVTSLKRVKST